MKNILVYVLAFIGNDLSYLVRKKQCKYEKKL
jgi:hypothetical protein